MNVIYFFYSKKYNFFDYLNNINGDFMYYINNFLLFSILGHILESIIYLFLDNGYSGIMYGPWTPVYGFGIILIILINKFLNKITGIKKVISLFIFSMILLTLIEYLGGITIEYFFSKELWSYTNLKFHIGKYIALEISLIWGICFLFYIFLIKPLTDKIIKRIPYYITICIIVFFIIDLIVTIINKIKL